jgi:hypothetical protein
MSQELPPNKNTNEEVDLIVFFNLIGNALSKVYNFVVSILKAVFSVIIHGIKVLLNNWKIIFGVMLISGVIGYALEQTKAPKYQSDMLVEPYFDSKYQLVTNIKYFNALIDNEDYATLKDIFDKDDSLKLNVENIVGFKIEPGPETENDRVLQYQGFMQRLDSVRKEEIMYEDYIKNRSIYSGDFYLISAISTQKDIFNKLENGVATAFTNQFSVAEFDKKERLRELQKQNLLTQLKEVDSLKSFYLNLRKDEMKKNVQNLSLGDISLSTDGKKATTREYELLQTENIIRDRLKELDEQKIEEAVLYDVISSFQAVGELKTRLLNKYSLVFPALAFILLCFIYILYRITRFANNYQD